MINQPTPPIHLKDSGLALWTNILSDWQIDSADALAILEIACSAADELAEAREIISKHGLAIETKSGSLKANPAAAVARSARAVMLKALSQLKLHDAETPKLGRPSNRI